ncbi:MAG: alpha-2-macroglobulin family protein, partial [Fimbriimonadaceae bacterium]
MYGDRTVYRAGETAYFKGIARTIAGKELTIPPAQPVTLQLLDESENVIGASKATMTDMGTFAGKFELSKEAAPGYYQVKATIGEDTHTLGVSVSAYRKPTYTITVTPEKPNYVRGERGRFKVHAEYYYGGPVPGAKVEGYVYSEIDWYDPEMQEYFESSEGRGVSGTFSESTETKTDDNGDAYIEFNTAGNDEPTTSEFDQRFSASVSVADEGGKYYDGTGSVLVTRGDFRLTTTSNVYVAAPNTPVTYKFKAEPFGDAKVAGQTLDVASGEEHWDGKGYTVLDAQRQTITLDENGEGTATVTPKHGGSLSIVGTMKDPRGNLITTTSYLWVSGTYDGDMGPVPSLSLKLDKADYKQGDNALALIQTDSPGGTALVTIESDKILLSKTVKLTDKMTSVTLPVLDEYTPQVSVTVSYVKDKEYASAAKRMQIDLGRRKLDVEVTPEKSKYQPGEMASFKVKTSVNGSPVPAEISLGLVDESIYAIAADTYDLAEDLYPKVSSSVETQYSFPQLYLDGGDKAPTSIQVRRIFKDTAFWAPSVYTDGTGQATLTMKLPDNLTTWRATVRGITNRSEAGQNTAKIVAAKDLMVRVEGPTFFVAGDKQTNNAVVTNSTDKDATVKLQFEPKNIALTGDSQRSVEVKAGGTASVQVELTASQTGDANLVAKAWIDGGANDGVEQHFEIRPAGVLSQETVTGNTVDQATFQLNFDPLADKNHGRVKITLAPTIGASVLQSLDDLIDFPYGCVEQTMSRFLPAIVAVQASKELGLPPLERAAELPAIVSDSLVRLSNMQHSDGGWGWWKEDETDAHMTAYVIEGLLRAKAYGYQVPDSMLTRGIEAATKLLEAKIEPPEWANTPDYRSRFWVEETNKRMYLAVVLSQTAGKDVAAKFVK